MINWLVCLTMTVVRERRHQRALSLSLPPPPPPPIFQSRRGSPLPSPDFPAEMEKLAVLGHGSGGTVYKARHRRNNSVYALKVIRLDGGAVELRRQAAGEAEILKRVDSEFIVKCHGVFNSENDDSSSSSSSSSSSGYDLCFLMEYMDGGSLADVLQSCRKLPEIAISGIARHVLGGLNYLHGLKIVHRDIKPSNLLINSKGEIKIADFGISQFVSNRFDSVVDSMGTSAYMSPERFDPERWEGGFSDGFAGDVWSLGVVVLECHVGRFPLIGPGQKPDWATLMCAICFGEETELPETMSPEFGGFVRRCLEKDWRQRGTVKELLNHPFVTQCGNSSEELQG